MVTKEQIGLYTTVKAYTGVNTDKSSILIEVGDKKDRLTGYLNSKMLSAGLFNPITDKKWPDKWELDLIVVGIPGNNSKQMLDDFVKYFGLKNKWAESAISHLREDGILMVETNINKRIYANREEEISQLCSLFTDMLHIDPEKPSLVLVEPPRAVSCRPENNYFIYKKL